jgi:signal transduction histidine kinase
MLQRIADRVVPDLADACWVYLVDRDGEVRQVAAAGGEVADAAAAAARAVEPPRLDPEHGVGFVLATGRSQLVTDLAAAGPVCAGGRRPHAMIAVPFRARAETVGAITLLACRDELRYGADTLALVEDLAHRIALVLHNARLYEDAQHAVEVRDEFLALASHELRTPLTPLIASVQALEQVAGSGDLQRAPPELLSRMLERIGRQAQRMRRLVESMLEVVELQAGRFDLHPAPTDLAAVARDVCDRMRELCRRAGCTLTLSAPRPVVGRWDRERLGLVLTQLLSNAAKYGAGHPVEVEVDSDGARARLVVTDHGMGVSPELAPTIFRRFERGVSVRSYGGLGLGLYLAKQIVDAHGGTIAVHSDPATPGATFVVELPLGPTAGET